MRNLRNERKNIIPKYRKDEQNSKRLWQANLFCNLEEEDDFPAN